MSDLPNASIPVAVLDVGVEVGALRRRAHESLVRFGRNAGVPVDGSCDELDFESQSLRVIADAAEV